MPRRRHCGQGRPAPQGGERGAADVADPAGADDRTVAGLGHHHGRPGRVGRQLVAQGVGQVAAVLAPHLGLHRRDPLQVGPRGHLAQPDPGRVRRGRGERRGQADHDGLLLLGHEPGPAQPVRQVGRACRGRAASTPPPGRARRRSPVPARSVRPPRRRRPGERPVGHEAALVEPGHAYQWTVMVDGRPRPAAPEASTPVTGRRRRPAGRCGSRDIQIAFLRQLRVVGNRGSGAA